MTHLTRSHAPLSGSLLFCTPPWKTACQCKRGRAKTYLSEPGPTRAELQAGWGALTAEKAARADALAGTGAAEELGCTDDFGNLVDDLDNPM